MSCGPHREGVPACDFLAIYSQTRPPLETSSEFRPEEPNSDDSYKIPMTRSDYSHDLEGAPARDFLAIHSQTRLSPSTSSRFKLQGPKREKGSRLRLPHNSLIDEAPA